MAILYDAFSTKVDFSVGSYTWAHTCTGINLILVVQLAWSAQANGRWISTVTYNGVALTKLHGLQNAERDRCEFWYLVNPATGTHNIIVTNGGGGDRAAEVALGATSYTGVNQDDPIRGFESITVTSTSVTKDISSGVSDLVVDVCAQQNGGGGLTLVEGVGQTERWNVERIGIVEGAGSDEAGAATVTMSWTSANAVLQLIVVSMKSAVSGTRRAAMFFSLSGLVIPAATLAGLYKAGAVAL